MAYPMSWDEINAKLRQLCPHSAERGKLRFMLLDMDEQDAISCFMDDDAAVRATLDALKDSGTL